MKLVSSSGKDGEMTLNASKPNSSSPLVNATKTTRLSFSGNDEVREIPRIGQTRVPPRPTSTLRPSEFAKSHPRQRRRPPPVVAPPIPAVPFVRTSSSGELRRSGMRRLSATVTERSMRGAAGERRRREEEAVPLRAAAPRARIGVVAQKTAHFITVIKIRNFLPVRICRLYLPSS